MLSYLKPFHPELPLDPRTILKTKTAEIIEFDEGQFIYYGIENQIKKLYTVNQLLSCSGTIGLYLDLNIDGLQVFKSRSTSFWPILVSCFNIKNSNPFIPGIFMVRKNLMLISF